MSVPGLAPVCLPARSTTPTELCCLRGEGALRLVCTVSLNPYCNPAVDGGHPSVLTLCSALCWHVEEKARQSDLALWKCILYL